MKWTGHCSSSGRNAYIFGGEPEEKTPLRTPKLKGKENGSHKGCMSGPAWDSTGS
jgi:hypothetical protein